MKVCCVNLSALVFAFTVFEAYIVFKTTAKTHNVCVQRGSHNKGSLVAEDNTHKNENQKPLLKSNDLL